VWVSRHLTGLWLVPGENKLQRGGVWVSRRLAELLLIPGVNELEQSGVKPTRRLGRLWLIPGVKELERGSMWVSHCLARLWLVPTPSGLVLPPGLLDAPSWRPHPSMRGGATIDYAAVDGTGMLVVMQMCGWRLQWFCCRCCDVASWGVDIGSGGSGVGCDAVAVS